jgi:hypothetical protein
MSLTVQYNDEGFPISGYIQGGAVVMTASGFGPAADAPKKELGNLPPSIFESYPNGLPWVIWGGDNNYPAGVAKDFRMNGVGGRALKLRTEMLYGKRVVPCRVTGYDEDAQKEIVEIVKDPEIDQFLLRSNINFFRNKVISDFVWLGMAFPAFLLNSDRSKISMVTHDKAAKFRFARFDLKLGRIPYVYRSANWPLPVEAPYIDMIPCIDSDNYYLEVDRIKYGETGVKYVFPVKSYDILNDYYAVTIHEAVRQNGWLDNSNNLPALVKSMIKNVISIKYHIKIPMSYWSSIYPNWDRLPQKDRDAIVQNKLQEFNDFLSGKDNQMKAFISHYMIDKMSGKEIAGWEIIPLEDKMKYDSWNGVATTANAEILFAIGINPAIFGLGAPGGAAAGGANNGGSNIRESWLTMIATSQGDRDVLYSWWPFVREYNGYDSDIELRTIDQVLTTLDQGKGTSKTLS